MNQQKKQELLQIPVEMIATRGLLPETVIYLCERLGYTEPFLNQEGIWYAFPPEGVIPINLEEIWYNFEPKANKNLLVTEINKIRLLGNKQVKKRDGFLKQRKHSRVEWLLDRPFPPFPLWVFLALFIFLILGANFLDTFLGIKHNTALKLVEYIYLFSIYPVWMGAIILPQIIIGWKKYQHKGEKKEILFGILELIVSVWVFFYCLEN